MEIAFKILAVAFAIAAGVSLWQDNGDAAFITAVLGAVSFFLSIRFEVKKRLARRAAEQDETGAQDT